ncbi:MAG: hypothetical protein ABR915_18495 [Thermoguttaceae bacterium]
MYQQANPNEMPGIGTTIVAVYKPIWKGRGGVQYLPGGGTIDGNNARDPANTYSGNLPNAQTNYVNVLEPGLLMGKITASGFYGASVFGLTSAAILANATSFKVPIAVGQEIIRRLGGVTGSLYLTGPATAGGTVNQQAVTVTNVAATGDGTTYTVTLYAGVTYAAVASSLVQPADGSQTIKTFVDEEDGIRVTDINGNGLNIQFPRIPIAGGVVNAPNIVNYPSDSALKTWVKSALKTVGPFTFDDDL